MGSAKRKCDSSNHQHQRKRARKSTSDTSDHEETPETSTSTSTKAVLSSSEAKKLRWEQKYKGLTIEERLERQAKVWYDPSRPNASKVYAHFQKPYHTVIKGKDMFAFVCKKNPSVILHRAPYEDSTGNFSQHILKCDPEKKGNIAEFAAGTTYSAARLRYLISKWCTRRKRPFEIVKDEEFEEILTMLYSRVDIPSPSTVSRDVQDIYSLTKASVTSMLQNHVGKIHVAVDGWSSPNHISVLGISMFRYVHSRVQEFTFDFVRLFQSHTGVYLAEVLFKALKESAIADKLLGVACDNAENNATMVDHLPKLIPSFRGQKSRIRCFAHILNLVVKAILSVFTSKKFVEGAGDTRGDQEMEDDEEDDDVDPDREAWDGEQVTAVETEVESRVEEDDIRMGTHGMTKLAKLCRKCANNSDFRGDLKDWAVSNGLDSTRLLVKPVSTRWNTTSEMLTSGINLKGAITDVCDRNVWNSKAQRLRPFIPTDEEWEILEQLEPILEIFLNRTKEFSKDGIALLHQVIPAMDKLTEALSKVRDDDELHSAVRLAATRGITMLNKYYSKTDFSDLYRVAMIMHPEYKTQYFRTHEWNEEWIQEAIDIARKIWKNDYCPAEPETTTTTQKNRKKNYLEEEFFASAKTKDAFDEYLSSPPITNMSNPFTYWEGIKNIHPELAQMGFDYCSAPATSVHTERSFSGGSHMVSRFRHGLSDNSICAGVVLSSWIDQGFVVAAEVQDMFKARGRRWEVEEQGVYVRTGKETEKQPKEALTISSGSESD